MSIQKLGAILFLLAIALIPVAIVALGSGRGGIFVTGYVIGVITAPISGHRSDARGFCIGGLDLDGCSDWVFGLRRYRPRRLGRCRTLVILFYVDGEQAALATRQHR
jgi:hypothetical protein